MSVVAELVEVECSASQVWAGWVTSGRVSQQESLSHSSHKGYRWLTQGRRCIYSRTRALSAENMSMAMSLYVATYTYIIKLLSVSREISKGPG